MYDIEEGAGSIISRLVGVLENEPLSSLARLTGRKVQSIIALDFFADARTFDKGNS